MPDVDADDRGAPSANVFWWATLGYAGLAAFGWLTYLMSRLLYWRSTQRNIAAALAAGDAVLAQRGQAFAGSIVVDMLYALGVTAIFAFVTIAVSRRTWNAWDYATVALGFPAALSLVFLCAPDRTNLFLMAPTMLPLLLLLYLPGTKAACGVPVKAPPEPPAAPSGDAMSRAEIEQEIARERNLIVQLSQNLDVFEVERAMDTDVFVRRYTDGLEEENADNAEWFAIARAVRRSRERLQDLKAQLESIPDQKG